MNKKIIASLVVVSIVVAGVINSVFAVNASFPSEKGNIGNLSTAVGNTWATATFIVQILAISSVIFAGVRYMFVPADKKADIKKGLMYLVIGAVFVFMAASVAKFIVGFGEDII